jgi:hypothetical protein
MDPATLAIVAANALVVAVATDAWEKVRGAVVSLWKRVHPDRAAAIDGELRELRNEALIARQQGDAIAEEGRFGSLGRGRGLAGQQE